MDNVEYPKLRKRAWFITINNPNEDDLLTSTKLVNKSEYGLIGDETAPTTGTHHIHVYIRLKDAVSFASLKKQLPRADIQPAKGTDKDCKNYCSKDKVLVEVGVPSQQGKRSDLQKVTELIKDDPRMSSIIEQVGSLQSIRTAEKLLIYKEPKRNWKTKVFWFCGATGTGKSREAFELYPDAYPAMDTGEWWEGYDAHEEVIIDDMRKDFLKFHQLLKLFDRYPYRVQFKGGSRQFLARTIIVTSCYSPEEMFDTREDIQQLLRRIEKIKYFSAEIKYP